jgi:hypothetical protein
MACSLVPISGVSQSESKCGNDGWELFACAKLSAYLDTETESCDTNMGSDGSNSGKKV